MIATIRQCPHRDRAGAPPACWTFDHGSRRKRCPGCRAELRAVRGHAVLIPHSAGSGRYRLADAVCEFRTWAAADRASLSGEYGSLVARFIIDHD